MKIHTVGPWYQLLPNENTHFRKSIHHTYLLLTVLVDML